MAEGNNSPQWLPPILLPFPLTQSSPFENWNYDIQTSDVISHIWHFDFDKFGLSAWIIDWIWFYWLAYNVEFNSLKLSWNQTIPYWKSKSYVVHLSTFNCGGSAAWKSGGVINRLSSISASINRVLTKGGWPPSSITISPPCKNFPTACTATPVSPFLTPSHIQSRLSNCRLRRPQNFLRYSAATTSKTVWEFLTDKWRQGEAS